MGLILNIESSTEVCSVALSENGNLISLRESDEGQNHARMLSIFVEEVLLESNKQAKDLSAVSVSQGPGSYTGLRIGVSLAKGICYANQIPLIAVCPLQAMSSFVIENRKNWNLPADESLVFCPMIDARRMEVYTALFSVDNTIIEDVSAKVIDDDTFKEVLAKVNLVYFGNGAKKCRPSLEQPNAFFIDNVKTSAQFMCSLSQKAFENKQFEDLAYFEPFYLKDFIAGVPRKNILKS